MITVYNNKYPTFATASEYYDAAMKYQSRPQGVPCDDMGRVNSPYLAYLWAKYEELAKTQQPIIDCRMNNQY